MKNIEDIETEEIFEKCELCEVDVPSQKFKMHKIGCQKQYYKCEICQIQVLKAEREIHEEK